MIRVRQFFTAAIATIFTLCISAGIILGVPFSSSPLRAFLEPPSAIAADYSHTQSDYSQTQKSQSPQESQSYPSQSSYAQAQDTDSYTKGYAAQQTSQTSPRKDQGGLQEKQTNQSAPNEPQYAQQEQTYPAE